MKEQIIFNEIVKDGEVIGFSANDGSLDYEIRRNGLSRIESSGVTMFGIFPDSGGDFPSGAGVQKSKENSLEYGKPEVITGSNDYPGQPDPISPANELGVKNHGIYLDGGCDVPLRERKVSQLPSKGY
jgi:hypothetical protein